MIARRISPEAVSASSAAFLLAASLARRAKSVSSYSNPGYVPPAPTITAPQLKVDMAGNPLMTPPAWLNQPLNVNVNVKVQDGQVRDLVRSEVETNNQQAFNMLMQGGPN